MVFRRQRNETREAAQLRDRRQHFAAPGSSHDRTVRFLAMALPMAVGVVAALMVITPLSPRGEVSFLLERDEVAMIDERLRVDNAMYRGQDDKGRPFSLTAGEAVQRSSAERIVRLRDMVARILLPDGPALLKAQAGAFDLDEDEMLVPGAMEMMAADGYRMLMRGVTVDLDTKRVTGAGGVRGAIPAGTFSADRLEADLAARTIALIGDAHLRMVPGELRMP